MLTIEQIAADIRRPLAGGRVGKSSRPISEGVIAEPIKRGPGLWELTPPEVMTLKVPVLEVGNEIAGYQRDARKSQLHVREIAKAIERGVLMPTATVALWNKDYFLTDGGHRALAAIMTDTLFRCEIRELNEKQQRELFHHQTNAKKLGGGIAILTGETPLAEYVQDVVTAPSSPWDGMISMRINGNPLGKISPAALGNLVGMYVKGSGSTDQGKGNHPDFFDHKAADELAGLIRCFGTAATNPLAFDAMSLRAITGAAALILRRPERQTADLQRWAKHMPKFDFAAHRHLRKSHMVRDELIKHWNKRLPADRRVEI